MTLHQTNLLDALGVPDARPQETEPVYALRHRETGRLATWVATTIGDAVVGVAISYTLGLDTGAPVWVVCNQQVAEIARTTATPWFDADYLTPQHAADWNPADWQIIRLEVRNAP